MLARKRGLPAPSMTMPLVMTRSKSMCVTLLWFGFYISLAELAN
jgi:hypothetical protein